MNTMLTDDDLSRLLGEAASAYPVPEQGPGFVLEELGDAEPGKPWLRRRGVQLTAVAAAVVVAAVLAQSSGLSGPTLHKQQVASPTGGFRGVVGLSGGAGGGGGATGGTTGGAAPQDAVAGAPALRAPAAVPAPAPGAVSFGSAKSAPDLAPNNGQGSALSAVSASDLGSADSPRVVQTGSISLVVDNGKVSLTVGRLLKVAKQAGGYVSDQQTQEFGDNPSATVTMRVPVGGFPAVVEQIRSKGFGAKVVSDQSSGRDVTAQYADTEAQLVSLRAARARFLTILSGAKTIGEILTVQQRVDDVQGQLDRLEGARRVLANQSDYATLTVTVGQKADALLKTSEPSGLSKAWKDAKHGFSSGVNGLIARSGRALLVLLVAVVVLVLGRLGWRRARRRMV